MLRLAHPAPAGNGTDPPKRRKRGPASSLTLTHNEARRVGAAIKATARAYGGHDVLASVIGVPVGTLYRRRARTAAPPASSSSGLPSGRGDCRVDPRWQAHRGGALPHVRRARRWRSGHLAWGCLMSRCGMAVVDSERRAKVCGAPATTERAIYGATFNACADYAAHVDAMVVRVATAQWRDGHCATGAMGPSCRLSGNTDHRFE